MGNYVDHETEESTKKLLVAWYKESATGWQPSDRTVAVVAEILEASGSCSSLFKFVPKPSSAFSGVGILASETFNYAKDAVKRTAKDKQTYYNACVIRHAEARKSAVMETLNW